MARELIQLGLQRECKSFTNEIAKLVRSAEWETEDPHELYLKLYKKIKPFDKHIALRYDGVTGSHYFNTVFRLFYDNIITEDDIAGFDSEIQNKLREMKKLF